MSNDVLASYIFIIWHLACRSSLHSRLLPHYLTPSGKFSHAEARGEGYAA